MATSGQAFGNFSPANQYQLRLDVSLRDTLGNSSRFDYALYVIKTSAGSGYALSQYAPAYSINIGGWGTSGSHDVDLRYTDSYLVASGTSGYIAHDANGNLTLTFAASLDSSGANPFQNGYCSSSFAVNRIPKAPKAPTITALDQITQSSIRCVFSDASDNGGSAITSRQVRYSPSSTFASDVVTLTGNSPRTATGLSGRTRYYFQARTINAIGASPWSATQFADTVDLPDAPSIALFDKTNTMIVLVSTDPAYTGGTILARETQISTSPTFATVLQTQTTTNPSFTGLTRATQYYMRQRIQNSVGWSPWSTTLNVQTNAEIPSTPTGYVPHDIATTTAFSTLGTILDNGGTPLTQVNYQIADDVDQVDVTLDTAREPLFTGLIAGVGYIYRLRVSNGQFWSNWGEWVNFSAKTNVPSAPVSFSVDAVSDTTVTLEWAAPLGLFGSTITGYRVRIGTDKGLTQNVQEAIVGPTELSRVFVGLTPSRQYYARVLALSNNGDGSTTEPLGFMTTGSGSAPGILWENVGGTWKRIINWENVLGVWKQIKLWENVGGTWKS